MSDSFAIIGISCLFPKADDLRAYWANIKNGVDAIVEVPKGSHWNVADYFNDDPKAPDRTYGRRGGFLSPVEFNPLEFGMAPNDIEATDTTQLLGMVAAKRALEDAGYSTKPFNRERASVILGVTGALELVIPLGARLGHPIWRRALKEAGVDDSTAEDVVRKISDSYVGWQENSFPGLLGNVTAGRIASRLDLGGTNCVVDAACASSLAALHLATLELATHKSDMVITGGVDTFNDIFMYMCFSKTPALSPTGAAKPFDRDCDGTILGEGLGMLVLKRLADAQRDGDQIYAVIKGIGSSSDGKGSAIYAPRSDGQKEALRRAYQNAGITPDTVELIEAHGTGTKVGDAAELRALTEIFRETRPEGTWAALGSVKSQVGHTKAAAGVAGLIKAALALHRKVQPPTIKVAQPLEEAGPGRSPFFVNTQKRPWLPRPNHPRRAGVSSFGFGGTNFHCVLEEHDPVCTQPDWEGEVEILAFHADSKSKLIEQLKGVPFDQNWSQVQRRAHKLRLDFKPESPHRLLVPLTKGTDWAAQREQVVRMLQQAEDKPWTLPNGVTYGSGTNPQKLAALFPGQGSQYLGMFRDLACIFPEMLHALAHADEVFEEQCVAKSSTRLSDFIYPHPAFDEQTRRGQEEALKSTEIAQPALGAVGLGALALLNSFGVYPQAAAGHSYGELLALCGAGVLKPASLHLLSNVRGKLMANRNGHSDRGAMLSVQAPEETVRHFLSETQSSLVIANRNSPNQFVLAGAKKQIEEAASALETKSIRSRVLAVSAAFHSPMVADAREPFAGALESIDFAQARIPVYANSSATAYPANSKQARELLANQIVSPVNFIAQIQSMYDDGVKTFIEVGPGHVLTDLVQAILPGKPVQTIALDSSRGTRAGLFDLAAALCRLAAQGFPVNLARWEHPRSPETAATNGKASFTIQLSGANYRKPTTKSDSSKSKPSTSNGRSPLPAPSKTPTPAHQTKLTDSPRMSKAPGQKIVPENVPNESNLSLAEQGLLSLQRLQEQTAQLHRQFLENQDAARRTLESLLQRRREMRSGESSSTTAPVIRQPEAAIAVSSLPEETVRPTPAVSPSVPERAPTLHTAQEEVLSSVLQVVSEKTGYPVEMLNLDMGLDSDLGIDSIKRVEIMAALRTKLPESPEVKPEHMGKLQTLQEVVNFLAVHPQKSDQKRQPRSGPGKELIGHALLKVVSEKTGYPVEMLNLDMALDADLGVDSIKRVEIMAAIRTELPSAPEIRPEQLGTLITLRQVTDFLAGDHQLELASKATNGTAATAALSTGNVPDQGHIGEILLQVVSDKTGYPIEMLNLEMGLDTDLGIDSIKRVEILAAVGLRIPHAPEIKPDQLGTLRTLNEVVRFLSNGHAENPKPARPQTESASSTKTQELQRRIIQPVQLPQNSERPEMQLPAGACIWVTEDGSQLAVDIQNGLEKRGYLVRRNSPSKLLSDADKAMPKPSGLILLWPATGGDDRALKEAFRLIQLAGPHLRKTKGSKSGVLLSVSRLDGVFGFGSLNGNSEPTSGGLAGLVKTAHHEWPEVHCKAIDVNPEVSLGADVADRIIEEMFRLGPVEVGLSGRHAVQLVMHTVPLASNGAHPPLSEGDLVVVSGGGRGITAQAVLQLARKHRIQLALLGRSPFEDAQEPAWLSGLSTEAEIKRVLLKQFDRDLNPKQLDAKFRQILAQREIREQLRQVQATGAGAIYRTVDVRNARELQQSLQDLRRQFGPIRGLIHGAGVLADRRIEDKTEEQFDLVYGTKVIGLRNMLEAAAGDDLKVMALFSSYSGRFGRTGQADYAAANEVLNKIAQHESRRRPGCRVVSFNWGPWSGGMVSDGLRKVFEAEGVGLIEPTAGAEFFMREINGHSDNSVEVVAMAHLPKANSNGVHPAAQIAEPLKSEFTLAFEREVSVKNLPCLSSHVLNGQAVMPVALMVEWLAHGAVHGNPGLCFHGFQNFNVLKGLVLGADESATVGVLAAPARTVDGALHVAVELVSNFKERPIRHARAEIILGELAPSPSNTNGAAAHANGKAHGPLYGNGQLFHGAHFQGIESLEHCLPHEVAALVKGAPAPKQWIQNPLRPDWMSDPLALDCSFQMMILWTRQHRQAPSLPCAIRRFRQFVSRFPRNGTRIVIRVAPSETALVQANIDLFARDGTLLASAEGYECALDKSLESAFTQNSLK